MAGQPTAGELVTAVREFVAGLAERGTLAGRDAFHARVAANVLAIVERELAGEVDAIEVTALSPYCHPRESGDPMSLGPTNDRLRPSTTDIVTLGPRFRGDDSKQVEVLRTMLCSAIRAGTLTAATPGLINALIIATRARLAVDNPRYPTLARLAEPVAALTDPAPRR